jgi:phosphate transport system protein
VIRHLNAYDRALVEIGQKLWLMSQKVGARLSDAMHSFIAYDSGLAQTVVAGDDEIDALDEAIEMESLDLISLQQPVDRDLRFLAAAIRISRELERIGDYACDIAEATLQMKLNPGGFHIPLDVAKMAEMVQTMLHKSLKAHLDKDLGAAGQMDDDDTGVDRMFVALLEELTGYMKRNPDCVEPACSILLVVRYLERIGDHAVNIAEMTIFTETGERHPFKDRH